MAEKKYETRAWWRTDGAQIDVKAESHLLELGHLRAVVAASYDLCLPDDADVYLKGVEKSYVRLDEFTAKTLVIRAENYARALEPGASR